MTANAVDKKEISAGALVDTLFGLEKMPDRTARHQAIADEELHHYLFDVGQDQNQAALPLINVPHYRSKVIAKKTIVDLVPYLDELALFEQQWGFVKKQGDRESWCHQMKADAVPILERVIDLCQKQKLLQPKALYSYFFCAAEKETLYLYKSNKADVFLTIDFPRLKNGVCVTDKFVQTGTGKFDTIAAVAVNMGRNATEMAKRWLAVGKDLDYRYFHGFVLEMLNAMTRCAAATLAKEECCLGDVYFLGTAKQGNAKVQSALIKMLDASLIDIAFSRNYLMMPEYSSLAIVFPH